MRLPPLSPEKLRRGAPPGLEREEMSKATIKDVARAAGVSLGTASRVVNGHKSVSDRVRQQVTAAIAELGYEPDAVAQSMRKGATLTIGVVIRDITVPALADFVK